LEAPNTPYLEVAVLHRSPENEENCHTIMENHEKHFWSASNIERKEKKRSDE
jgi:hypothetical protein